MSVTVAAGIAVVALLVLAALGGLIALAGWVIADRAHGARLHLLDEVGVITSTPTDRFTIDPSTVIEPEPDTTVTFREP